MRSTVRSVMYSGRIALRPGPGAWAETPPALGASDIDPPSPTTLAAPAAPHRRRCKAISSSDRDLGCRAAARTRGVPGRPPALSRARAEAAGRSDRAPGLQRGNGEAVRGEGPGVGMAVKGAGRPVRDRCLTIAAWTD